MDEKLIIEFLFNFVGHRRRDLEEASCRVKLGLGPLLRQVVPTDVEKTRLEETQKYLADLLHSRPCGDLVETGQPARTCARPRGHEGNCADADNVERYPALYSAGSEDFGGEDFPTFTADPQPDYDIGRAVGLLSDLAFERTQRFLVTFFQGADVENPEVFGPQRGTRVQEYLRKVFSDWSPYDPRGSYKEDTYWVALGQDVVSAKFVIMDEGVGSWLYDDGCDPWDKIDMADATHVMPRAVPAPPQRALDLDEETSV